MARSVVRDLILLTASDMAMVETN